MSGKQPKQRGWLRAKIYKIFFPSCCILCNEILPSSDDFDICEECSAKYEKIKPTALQIKGEFFDGCLSVYAYRGAIREAMMNFKFKHKAYIAPVFARKMAEQIKKADIFDYDIITWVPVHRRTLRKRGYDQAELLAREMAKELGDAAVPTLKKIRITAPMHTLKAAERRANVLGAYAVLHSSSDLSGIKILLVDDTLTTGSTIAECARILKTSGAEKVWCITFAKTEFQK